MFQPQPAYQPGQYPYQNQIPQHTAQRYVYVDPGRQPYINPAHIQSNQNYYQSPIIQNPPLRQNTANYGMYDPYTNYNNYYQNYYQNNCGCAGQYNYGSTAQYNYGYGGCQGQYYGQQYSPCGSYGYNALVYGAQGGCGCGDCYQYGLSINKDRITPKFPSKLGHSYVTSGDRVQNKLVINEPSVQSAPFQTQRRKTYMPYTRKYFDYQDYVQYIPVQKSEWAYKKVMKQIDFVPQQYYETSVQVVPRERLDNKVRYIPVQQEIIHVPQQNLVSPASQSNVRRIQPRVLRNINSNINVAPSVMRPSNLQSISRNSVVPLPSSGLMRSSNPPADSQVLQTIFEQNRGSSIIHPAQSTVQMVSNARLQHLNRHNRQTDQQNGALGTVNQQNSYHFPSSGGVIIGSSSQTQTRRPNTIQSRRQNEAQSRRQNPILSSFGPGGGFEHSNQNRNPINIEQSQVIRSTYENQSFGQNKIPHPSENRETLYAHNFRQSGHVESQDFNFDSVEYQNKRSIFNKFEEDSN